MVLALISVALLTGEHAPAQKPTAPSTGSSVAPGPVWTPIIPASMPAETTAQFGATNPVGRPAQPAELAPAFVFPASQESSFVTGSQPLP